MKFKKLISIAVSVMIGIAMFAACATGTPEEEEYDDTDPSNIEVWSVDPLVGDYVSRLATNPNDANALMTKQIVEDFKKATVSKEHPEGIKVVIKNHGWGTELNKALGQAIATNTMPDLTIGEQFVKTYVNGGQAFQELNLSQEITSDLIDATESVIYKNGKLFAVPVWTGSFALNINKAALAEFGILSKGANGAYTVNATWLAGEPNTTWKAEHGADLDPLAPKTWEELYAICDYIQGLNNTTVNGSKLTGVGGILMSATKDGSAWRALAYMRTAGGDMVDANNDVTLNTPENMKAFEMMRKLSGTAPARSMLAANEKSQWSDFFFKNKAAYTVDGSDIASMAESLNRRNELEVVELPTFEESGVKANVLVGTGYFSMSKTTTKQKECQAFLEYLLSPEVQRLIMKTDNRIACRKSVLESEETKALPNYGSLEVFMAPFVESNGYDFQGGLPTFDNNPSTVWEYWNAFASDLLKTDKGLTGIVQTAQSNMYNAAKGQK